MPEQLEGWSFHLLRWGVLGEIGGEMGGEDPVI